MNTEIQESVTGVILAGGAARRMGGQDKGLVMVAGRPMIDYVIASLREQLNTIIINANRNLEQYHAYGYPVISDELGDFQGPLAGMASCMRHACTDYMLTLPCDSPYVPADLVARLYRQLTRDQADISVAHNGERLQPVFSLLRTSLLASLLDYLDGGERKIDRWYEQHKMAICDFSDRPETFINVNTPEDVQKIEATLAHG